MIPEVPLEPRVECEWCEETAHVQVTVTDKDDVIMTRIFLCVRCVKEAGLD